MVSHPLVLSTRKLVLHIHQVYQVSHPVGQWLKYNMEREPIMVLFFLDHKYIIYKETTYGFIGIFRYIVYRII